MRRLFVVGILLLARCQGVSGPFRVPRARDDPLLTISEQKARAVSAWPYRMNRKP